MATVAEKYSELGIAAALGRPYDYPTACVELAALLRRAYSRLPKSIQPLVFHDTIHAFRQLPQVQTTNGLSAANLLVQAAEAALPKQKRTAAVAAFKHAAVAHKRLFKVSQQGESRQLPEDVLIHIFSFLDFRSLAAVSSVCWAWNSASSDETLWRSQISLFFGSEVFTEAMTIASTCQTWKRAFQKYIDYFRRSFPSNRALCNRCMSIIWISKMSSRSPHDCTNVKSGWHITSVPPVKVVSYLLEDSALSVSSSESDDSDSDDLSSFSKLWASPKLIDTGE